MKAIEHVLIAMDLSGTDYRLLDFVKLLAGIQPGFKAHFLHVTHPVSVPAMAWAVPDTHLTHTHVDNQLKIEMEEEVFAKLSDTPVELSFDVAEGNVTGELIQYTQELDADLVMVGQKEHSMGSGVGAQRFLRNSTASVLFVPEHAGTHINHILVPVDFSDASARAVEQTLEIARKMPYMPKITLLHVFDMPAASHFARSTRHSEQIRQYERNIEAYFPTFLNRFDPGELTLETAIVDNAYFNTARKIASYAQDNLADLVIMGARGNSTATTFLLGAVTEKFLAYNENVPVLIVK